MDTELLSVHTGDRRITDVTELVASWCAGRGDGLCQLLLPHATAGLALMEVGSGSDADTSDALDRVLPRDHAYHHRHGSPGHGADHVLPVFVSPSLSLPVQAGRVLLGVWQSIVVVDPNPDNPDRQLRCSWIPVPG